MSMPRGIYPRRKNFSNEESFQIALKSHYLKVESTKLESAQTDHRKAQTKAASLRYERSHKAIRKEQKLKARYGITGEQYDLLFQNQNGLCAICEANLLHKSFGVDHIHTTKTVRGLLCWPCNIMIGLAKDNPNVLRAAANYVEASSI